MASGGGGFSAMHSAKQNLSFAQKEEPKKIPGGQKYVDPRRQKKRVHDAGTAS